jgi:sugar/nucleoside kinase (ribokinase family)
LPKISFMDLLGIGSVAFDAIETPFGKTGKIIGGAGTFISLASSFFSSSKGLVSVVGGDFPQETLNMLQEKGIDINGIQIKKEEKTFFWSGKYHNDMNSRDTLVTELNVLEDFNPILPLSYTEPRFLMLGNLSPLVQKQVIEQLRSKPILIAMDTMNFWMDIAMDELISTIGLVDLLIINDEEARQLTGAYSLKVAAKKIHDLGPKYVIIKKGEHGALLFGKGQVFFAPALPLEEVFDPTGAGDTFAGGFMGYLSQFDKIDFEIMKKAVIYGSALASFCVEKFGTERLTEIGSNDLENRVKEFYKLTQLQ